MLKTRSLDGAIEHRLSQLQNSVDPVVGYVPAGDYLSVLLKDEPYFAQRIDNMLTVYLSMATKDLVGCKIKGVSVMLENAEKHRRFKITDEMVSVSVLILSVSGDDMTSEIKNHYYDVCREVALRNVQMPVEQIRKSFAASA